jgi:hypothetical protein
LESAIYVLFALPAGLQARLDQVIFVHLDAIQHAS